MAEEQQGGNVARVGLSLDSSAFRSGVQRTLADIESLLSGLRKLGSAGATVGTNLLGPGGKSAPLQLASDIRRTTLPALQGMERQILRVNTALAAQNRLQESSIAAFTAASKARRESIRQETLANLALMDRQDAARRAEARARLEEARSDAAIARNRAAQLAAERQYLADLRASRGSRSYTPAGTAYPASTRLRQEMEAPATPSFMPHPSGTGQMGYKYVVVPLKDVVTSKDPGFPGLLQPRDRGTEKSNRQIETIINSPKWGQIFQATDNLERGLALLVNMEGRLLALQGNARTLGTRGFVERVTGPAIRGDEAAKRELASFMDAQRAFLKANGAQFQGGASGAAQDFARLTQAGQVPYIARIVAQTVDELGGMQGLGRIALQANNRSMTPQQEAIAVARLLGRTPNFGSGSASQIVAKTDLIRAFAAEVQGIVGFGRYQETYQRDDARGNTPEWAKLLERTLAARAFGSDTQTERLLNAAFSGQSSPLASKSFMEQLIKGVGDQLAIRARVEAGHIPPEMDPFYQRLGPALQVVKDVSGMYGPAVLKDRNPGQAMTRINAATAGGMAGVLGDIPTDDVKQLAQSIMVAGDKGMPALIKALSVFASRVESPTTPSLFGAEGGTLPMEFGKMLEAAQQSVVAYTKGLSDELAKLRQTKPGAKSIAAGKAEEILNSAVNGTLLRIAESYAKQLGTAPVTPPPAPSARPDKSQPYASKEDALLRARGEDLRTFGMNPRLTGTAPNYDYAQATAEAQAEFNKALMAGMTRYREYVRTLANASRVLRSGASVSDAGLPEYYMNAYRTGMPIDKVMAEMKESMRKIGKILKANYDLLGSRGILESFATTTRRAASAMIPPGGPAAMAPFGSLPFEGKFDPNTLAYNVPDKMKYTQLGVTGMSRARGEALFAAIRPMLDQYYYSQSQTFNPYQEANVPAKNGVFSFTDVQTAFQKMLNRGKAAGLVGVQMRGAAMRSNIQGEIEAAPSTGYTIPPQWSPMGAQSTSKLQLNAMNVSTPLSLMSTLIHEIAHTSMRAAYGDRAGFYGTGSVPGGVEMDPRFGRMQFDLAQREKMAMPMAIEKILGMAARTAYMQLKGGDKPTMMHALVNEAQQAGALKSHAQQPMYVEAAKASLSPAEFERAQEVAKFIMATGGQIAATFAQGGQPAAFESFKDAVIQFAGLTAPMVQRTTYALEAAATLMEGYVNLPKGTSTSANKNAAMLGGQTIRLLEQALSRMVGTGRMLPYANALAPDLAAQMQRFVAIQPLEMLQAIHDITNMATGKVKSMEALSGKPADDLRASLLGLVRDFEKASDAAKKFATSSEMARAQVTPGGSQANAPPSISNILPPSVTAPKQIPTFKPTDIPLLGAGAGTPPPGGGGFGGGGAGGGSSIFATGGAGGGGGTGGGGGFGGGTGGGSPFENFRSWWAANGAGVKQLFKFVAGSGYPLYGGPGVPDRGEYTTPGGQTMPLYSQEQMQGMRNRQRFNQFNAAYQGTIGNILPEYRSAYDSYARGRAEGQDRSAGAKRAFVEQQLNAQAAAGAQSRLNMIMRDGHIQFGQLAKAATAVGNGMMFSTAQTVKFAAALAFGRQVTMTIIQVFDHFRGGIIKFNADIEAASVGFTTLFKNSGMTIDQARVKTEETIQTLLKFANVTNFRFGDLETAALRMKAFGFEIDTAAAKAKGQMPILEALKNPFDPNAPLEFRGAIVNIGDAVAALGAEDDKLRRVTYALGQMNSAGRVYQNDMMQLANAGIAGYEILSKELLKELEADGKQASAMYKRLLDPTTAVEEVRKLARTGKISGPAAVQAIMRGLEERYGGGMKAFSKTFRGAMTTIADTSQYLIATAFKPFFEMVRDQTYKLATFLQTGAATKQAKEIGVVIGKLTDGIKEGMPGALKILETFAAAFTNVIASFSNNLTKPGNTFVGFFDSFAKGLGIVGDILSNQVIGRLVATGVAMKVLTSAMAANPLMATLIGGTALVGFLGNAAETNAFGMGETITNFTKSIQNALSSTSESLVPTLTTGMSSALQVIGGMLLTFTQSIIPILQKVVEIFSAFSGTLTTIAPLLGSFFGLWIGKKILIDGIAAAMLRMNAAGQGFKGWMGNLRAGMEMASIYGARGRYARETIQTQVEKTAVRDEQGRVVRDEKGRVLTQTQFSSGPAPVPGRAVTVSAGTQTVYDEFLRSQAAKLGTSANAVTYNSGIVPGERVPIPVAGQYGFREFMAWTKTPEGKAVVASAPAADRAQFAQDTQVTRDAVRSFGQALKSTFTTMDGFKAGLSATGKAIAANLGQFGQGLLSVGIGLSALGTMMNNEFLRNMGSLLTNIGLFAMGLQALMGIFTMLGASTGWGLILTGATVALAGLAAAAGEATKKFQEMAGKTMLGRELQSAQDEVAAFKAKYGDDTYTNLTKGLDRTLSDEEFTALNQQAFDLAKQLNNGNTPGRDQIMAALKYLQEQRVPQTYLDALRGYDQRYRTEQMDLVYGEGPYRQTKGYAEKKRTAQDVEILSLFGKGIDMDSIAKMIFGGVSDYANKRITDAIAAAKGTTEGEKALKLLQGAVDVSGEIAQNAAEALQKAADAFMKPLQRLMSRANEVLRAVFEEEKKALETERSTALDNIMVMYDGEVMRLGALKEQHAALVAQREETEKLRALEKEREAAAEAAAAMFDAGTDPLQRAVAAREAARNLVNQQEQGKIDNMAAAISAGEASVSYKQTSNYFDDKLKQLETDQQERQRKLDERIQDLQTQIQEGKISIAAAKAELASAFADAGIDLNVLRLQGSSVGEQFGSGFWQGLTSNIDAAFKKLPAYVRAAAAKLSADAALKAAQESLAAAMEPKVTYVPAQRVKESLDSAISDLKLKQQQVQLLDVIAQMQPGYDKKKPGIAQLSAVIRAQIEQFTKQRSTLTPGSQRDTQELTAISQTLSALLEQITSGIKTLGINGPLPNMPYPHAQGGPVQAGQSYLVGERGPEVLAVGRSGKMQVIPNHMLPTYLRSSAGALMAGKTGRMRGFAEGTPLDPSDIPAIEWIRGITNPYNRFIHQIRTTDPWGGANLPTLGMDLDEYNDRLKLLYVLSKAGVTRILNAGDLKTTLMALAGQGKLPEALASALRRAPSTHHLSGLSGGRLDQRFDFEDRFFKPGQRPLSASMATSYVGGLAGDYSTLGGIPWGGSIEDVFNRQNQTIGDSKLTLITRPGVGKSKTTTTTLGDALSNRKMLPESIFNRFGGPLSVLLPGGRNYAEFQIPGGIDLSEVESILGLSRIHDEETGRSRAAQLDELGFLDLDHMAVAHDVVDRQLSDWRNGHAASGWQGAASVPQDDYRVTAALAKLRNAQSGSGSDIWHGDRITHTALALFKAGKFSTIQEAAHFAATFPLYAEKQSAFLRAAEAARQRGITTIEDARSTVKSISPDVPEGSPAERRVYRQGPLPKPTKTRLPSGGSGIRKFLNSSMLDFAPFTPRITGGTGERYSFPDFDIVVAPGVKRPVDLGPLIRGAQRTADVSPIGMFAGGKKPTIVLEAAQEYIDESGQTFDKEKYKTRFNEGKGGRRSGGLYGDALSSTIHITEDMYRHSTPDRISKTVAHELGHAIHYKTDAVKALLKNPQYLPDFFGINPLAAFGIGGGSGMGAAMNVETAKVLNKAAGFPVFTDPHMDGPQAVAVGFDGSVTYDYPQVSKQAVDAGLFPSDYSKTNPREYVAEVLSEIIQAKGDVTKVTQDPKKQQFLTGIADHYGLQGPGLKASAPTISNKIKGVGAKIQGSSKAQGIVSLMADVGQMWASGTLDIAHLGTSVFMNLLGMIPKLGGPFTALAGVATTILSGGDLTRLVVGQFGSLLGGILGQTFIPVPFLGGFIGNILGGMFGDWIYTTFMNKAAAANPAGMYAGGKGIFNTGAKGLFGGGRALGGSVFPGTAYLVGENGPELMVPSSLGNIIPNHKMRGPGSMAAGGIGGTINASVVINSPQLNSAADIDRLAAKVSEAQTRALRAAGYVRPR